MSCLGVLCPVTPSVVQKLRALPRGDRLRFLDEVFDGDEYRLDKSWDAMHRALTGGRLAFGNTPAPACWVILGGEVLYGDRAGEEDYILVSKTPQQVRAVADWLGTVTEEQFRRLYYAIDPNEYGMQPDEDDFGYTWEFFHDSLEFWQKAAENGHCVTFDVDQ